LAISKLIKTTAHHFTVAQQSAAKASPFSVDTLLSRHNGQFSVPPGNHPFSAGTGPEVQCSIFN
jgi:hypothetical protein